MKRNKFGAIKTVVDNIVFDSKREAAVYGELRYEFGACDITVHPKYDLIVNGQKIATYKPDFVVRDGPDIRVIDVKSKPTAKKRDFVLVRKLMKAIHGIDVEVIT
jgi:hypothetical protein